MNKLLGCVGILFFLSTFVFAAEKSETLRTVTINSAREMQYVKMPGAKKPDSENEKSDSDSAPQEDPGAVGGDAKPSSKSEKEESDSSVKEDKKSDAKTAEETEQPADDDKDEIVIFSGNVSISVADGDSTSIITADQIIYNRSMDMLHASGGVFYERKIGEKSGQTFKGEKLLFNIKEITGVFLDGAIRQEPVRKKQNPFFIQSNVVGRDASGVVTFKNGILSTSDEEYPLWSIKASRIWLLPGNELAFANGYFSIGVVPIFYLPFFYYPADEMITHPVFGFRNREGAFVQTTTYIIGRKPLPKQEEGSTFSNFLLSDSLKEQKLEGLFFKNLETPASNTNPSYLKLIADYYSGLGGLVGLDGKFEPKSSAVKKINFSVFFGVSRTLYKQSSTPLYSIYDRKGESHMNKSYLFGKKMPFRYKSTFSFNLNKAPFTLDIDFPLVSDPFFKSDYFNREEDMNWFKYLLNKDKLADAKGASSEDSFSWIFKTSLRPSIKQISPWISSFGIDSASFRVDFRSKSNKDLSVEEILNSPERKFFYQQLMRPEIRSSISGTLINNEMFKSKKKPADSLAPEGIKNPFIEEQKQESAKKQDKEKEESKDAVEENKHETEKTPNEEEPLFLDVFIPAFKIKNSSSDLRSKYRSVDFSLSYTGDVTGLQETIFDSDNWHKPEDVKWKEFKTKFFQYKGKVGLSSKISYAKDFLSLSNSLEFSGNQQGHNYVKNTASEAKSKKANYEASVYSLKNSNTLTIKPFSDFPMFNPIAISWNLSEILIKNKFTGTVDTPEWTVEKLKWHKDFITAHTVGLTVGVVLNEYTQKMAFTANLPPLLQAYSAETSFTFPYGSLSFSSKLFEKEKEKKKWFWDPFVSKLTFSLPYSIGLTQEYSYNIEEKSSERYLISFARKGLSASYTMNRDMRYVLDPRKGWVSKSKDKKFLPNTIGINYSNSSNPFKIYSWKNRLAVDLSFSSSLQIHLQKITDSYFTFTPSVTFKIHEFWDLSFGSTSRNDSIARYFQRFLNLPVVIPGETNILKDLLASFYFWDINARKSSGFKLKSLNVGLTHYLKDWTMKFTYAISPQKKDKIVAGKKQFYYEFTPTITFVVEWNPISDIKVKTEKKEKKFTLSRGEIK